MRFIHTYNEFLFEGGKALVNVHPIKQSQVKGTLQSIQDVVFPALGIEGWDKDALLIGSAGKKMDNEDSGDLDIGVAMQEYADKNGISIEQGLKYIYDILRREFPHYECNWMRGLEVVSLAFPIENNPGNGYVQVDFLPMKDMEWAKFIYHSPNYKKNESKYKSAHRNWLFAAILSGITEDPEFDAAGNKLTYIGYMLRLNDGLSRFKKSFEGKTKLLKNANIVHEEHVTNSPEEFVHFLLGDGVKPKDIETFESLYNIITRPGYKWADRLPEIKKEYIRFLKRVKLPVPTELKDERHEDDTER